MYGCCRHIGPFEVLERIELVAYRLALPPSLAGVHNVFNVSQLRKCLANPDAVLEVSQPKVRLDLKILKHPMKILDHAEKVLRCKTIPVVKVLWSGQVGCEATWETEDSMRRKYLNSSHESGKFRG